MTRIAQFEQVVRGVHEIHESGFVHRDIKPSNIMNCGDRLVLMDFGLARDTDGCLTHSGDREPMSLEPRPTAPTDH